MVPVEGAVLGVPSSTPPFSGSLGSAIAQRHQLLLLEQGVLQGFYTATRSRPSNDEAGMSQGQRCMVCSHWLFLQVHAPDSGTPRREGLRIPQVEPGCNPLHIRQGTCASLLEGWQRWHLSRRQRGGRDTLAARPQPWHSGPGLMRTARKEQPLLAHTQFAARGQLALARERKVSQLPLLLKN